MWVWAIAHVAITVAPGSTAAAPLAAPPGSHYSWQHPLVGGGEETGDRAVRAPTISEPLKRSSTSVLRIPGIQRQGRCYAYAEADRDGDEALLGAEGHFARFLKTYGKAYAKPISPSSKPTSAVCDVISWWTPPPSTGSDLTPEEFQRGYLGLHRRAPRKRIIFHNCTSKTGFLTSRD